MCVYIIIGINSNYKYKLNKKGEKKEKVLIHLHLHNRCAYIITNCYVNGAEKKIFVSSYLLFHCYSFVILISFNRPIEDIRIGFFFAIRS